MQQNIEIKLLLNVQKLNTGLNKAKGDFTKMADEIQGSLNRLRNVTKNGIMKDAFKDAIKQARDVRNELRELAKAEKVTPARSLSVQAKAFAVKDTLQTAGNKALYEQSAASVKKLTVAENEAIIATSKWDKSQRSLTNAAKEQIQVQNQLHQSWITGRYALYDVASAATQASQNFVQFTKSMYDAQFAQEQAFSQVQKTQIGTDPRQLGILKEQLIDLTKVIPKTFDEISKIAMLGSQLGIATSSLADFSDTVAKFSTITGVSVEETANSFGKLANLLKVPASQYRELGSSIAFVGVQAAATETEILSTAKQIASVANNAGFTADQVIGLSSAMASLATRPEEARGVLVPTFQAMDAAVRSLNQSTGQGNEALAVFAATSGMSAKDFADAWSDKKSGGAAKAFQSFITGLGKGDAGKILDQLSLSGVRTSKGLTALGNNAEEVARQIQAATAGMVAGDFLDKSFATTVDDIAVKIQLLGAAVQELMAASASNPMILQSIGFIVDGLKEITSGAADFTKGPFASFVAGLALAFVALTGAILGIGSAVATGIAAVYALRTALVALEAAGFAGKIMQIGAALLKLPEATNAATVGVQRFASAIKWTAIGLAASVVIAGVIDALVKLQDESQSTADAVNASFGDLTGLRDAMTLDTGNLATGGKAIATFSSKSQEMSTEMLDATRKANDLAKVLGDVGVAADTASSKTQVSSMAFGDSALNFTRAWLVTTDGFKKALEDPNFSAYFNAIGANIDTALSIAAKDGEQAVSQYFYDLRVAAEKSGKELPQLQNLAPFDPISAISGTSEYVTAIDKVVAELKLVKPAAKMAADGNNIVGQTAEEAAAQEASLSSEIKTAIEATFEYANAQVKAKDALYSLGQALQDNGKNFDDNTVKGRANIAALQIAILTLQATAGTNKQALVNDLAALQDQMSKLGIVSLTATGMINNAIYAATQGTQIVPNAKNSTFDFSSLTTGFKTVTASAGRAKTAVEKLTDALDKAFAKWNKTFDVQSAFDALGESIAQNGKQVGLFTKESRSNFTAVKDVIYALKDQFAGSPQSLANKLAALRAAMIKMGITSKLAFSMVDAAMAKTGKKGKALAAEIAAIFGQINGAMAAEVASSTPLRTITDYVNDLGSVLQDALTNRYAKQNAEDSIASAWLTIKESADAAKKSIDEANLSINEMKADKSMLEYQLQVAIRYGDTVRADAIQAKLNKLNTSIAEEQQKIADAQAEANKSLVGNSKAAIENRAKVRDLVQKYNEYLLSLAKTGASTETLKAEAAKLADEFLAQGEQMGFAKDELLTYTDAFKNDFTTVVDNLPKDVTLNVVTDPALQAVIDFVKDTNAELAKILSKTIDVTVPGVTTPPVDPNLGGGGSNNGGGTTPAPAPAPVIPAWVTQTKAEIKNLQALGVAATNAIKALNTKIVDIQKGAGTADAKAKAIATVKSQIAGKQYEIGQLGLSIAMLTTKLRNGGYARGGYVSGSGTGTSDSIPARLSNGEYVLKANAVKYYGTDFMNALNQMQIQRPAAGSSAIGGGVVYLSPDDRALLRAAIERPISLYTENTTIAKSANAGNIILAQRGER